MKAGGYQQLGGSGGVPTHVWVVDRSIPLLSKVDGTNPASPSMAIQTDLSAYGVGARTVQLSGGNVFVGMNDTKTVEKYAKK